jgi:hypothetical protein
MNHLQIPDPFCEFVEGTASTESPYEYTGKLRRIAWLLIACAFGRLIISTFFGPMSDSPGMHFELTAPYLFFVVAVFLVRTRRMARWAAGVAGMLVIVTWITEHEAEHHFWPYLSFWIDHISLGQSVVTIFFLFEAVRQYLKSRRVQPLHAR